VKDRNDMLNQSAHPLAGAAMTGAEMVVQVLADEGVDTIFGYSGGAILPLYDAVFRYNQDHESAMPLIVPANEQGAGFMAAGYARASGKVGVALVTSGPGATNTVTPVRDSMADSVPIVVICGQVPTTAIGTDAFQEAPVPSIMGAVAKHVFLVTDPAKLEATVRTAFEIARTGRPGPVVLDIPKDVQNWKGVFQGSGRLPIPGYRQRLNRLGAACGPAAADLCGRRGHQRQRRVCAARIRQRVPNSGGHDPHGYRRCRYHRCLVHAHARHARRCVRELCR
jgi:acetolactate synthase-1/2/3 large subunit